MPSSPITSKLERYDWDNWSEFENIVIPDENTDHFYKVHFYHKDIGEYIHSRDYQDPRHNKDFVVVGTADMGRRMITDITASLLACPLTDDPTDWDNWYCVEELSDDHWELLDIIQAVFNISFDGKEYDRRPIKEETK